MKKYPFFLIPNVHTSTFIPNVNPDCSYEQQEKKDNNNHIIKILKYHVLYYFEYLLLKNKQ